MEPSQRRISKAPGDASRGPQEPEDAREASENGDVGKPKNVSEQAGSEERLRFQAQLLDAVGQAIIATDLQGRVLYWNRCAEQLYGWSAQEVRGRALHEFLISEEFWENVGEIMSRLRAGKSWSGEFAVRRKDGTALSVDVTDTPVRDDGGNVVGVIGVSTDITERKRAEARLRETERRLCDLLSNIPALVYRCLNEPDWPGEYVSDYAMELTGYPAAAFMEVPTLFGNLISEKDKLRIWDEVQEAVGRGERFRLDYAIHHKDGSLRFVEELGQGVCDESGSVVAVEGLIYDVTDRKRVEERLREAEERYRTLVEQIPAVTYVDPVDDPDNPLYTSPHIERMLGYTPEEWINERLWPQRLYPEDRDRVLAADERFEQGEEEHFDEEYRLLAKDGSLVWVREEAVLVKNEEYKPLYWQGIIHDVTDRKEAEEALRRSEERYRTVVEEQTELVCRFSPDLILTFVNGAYCRYFGLEPEEAIGESFMDHVHERDHDYYEEQLVRLSPDSPTAVVEERVFTADGVRWLQWTDTAIFDGDGRIVEFQSVGRDVTERRRAEQRLEHQALHDPLTGLPNRRLFVDRLGQALRRTRRQGNLVAVLFMDLDDFKVVNDSLGHEAGDLLLTVVAQHLKRCLRPEDTLARFGGDEFVVLVEAVTDPTEAIQVAKRITDELRRPFSIEARELFVATSIGIALGEDRTKSPEDLLRDADTAMYRAKDEGSGYAVFDPAMYERALGRLEAENDLRRAMEREEFVLHYQPIVCLGDGRVRGVEALVRWNHPKRGFLSPDEFVPIAEESGLVVPIGERVLEEACRQAREWQGKNPRPRPPVVSVNLSARQLGLPDLTEMVEETLRKTGFDGSCLALDITETAYVEVLEGNTAALDRLKAMGVRISIDDFGTGYSSLSYLKRLPADVLKIDRSFVGGLSEDTEDTAVVRMIVELAHTFGMEVIAEGVETEEQAALLLEMGCDMAQGYLFSEPLAAKGAANLLDAVFPPNTSGGC